MRKALVLGGASKNGTAILETLIEFDFDIVNVGASTFAHPRVQNIQIDWNALDIELVHKTFNKFEGIFDFVFFNHKSSSLSLADFDLKTQDTLKKWKLIKHWTQSHWLSCQMPFLVLHTIRNNLNEKSKVGWMLSSYIDHANDPAKQYPDYSSDKYFNYLSMKCFGEANQFQTFGIYPDFNNGDGKTKLKSIVADIVCNDQLKQQNFKF